MTCEKIRERMLDVAAGLSEATAEQKSHLSECVACEAKLEEIRQSMALLDEWRAPEPSPYFDVRLQAHLREETAKPQTGWRQWFRRPVVAAVLTLLIGIGVGSFFARSGGIYHGGGNDRIVEQLQPGTAVSDLQALDRNHELYSDFELLDELSVQNDVTATP
jgi:hypothetical protein